MALTEAEELELLELEEQEAAAGARSAPVAPPVRASQADVRKSDAAAPALSKQDAAETAFNIALKAWLRTPTGQYFVGQPDIRERFSKATGRPDPLANRDAAEIEHARETGDVSYGTSTTYNVAKPLASMAGFAVGGPAGATGAEFLVRAAALADNLDKAVKAGAIDEERAADILASELVKGTATDAAWNFGLPLVGQLVQKVPGAKWVQTKLEGAINRVAARMGRAPSAPKPSLRDAKVDARAAETADPARQQAVRDLSARVSDDFVPTPGQVSGKPSLGETAANKAFPAPFEEQEAALRTAADGMLREATTPPGPEIAPNLGREIQRIADATQTAVKQRLRPTFNAADELGVRADFSEVESAARAALAQAERVPSNTPQKTKEIEALRKLVQWFETRAKRDGDAPLQEMKAELARLMSSRDLAMQEWGKFKSFEARQSVLADSFHPVPGQPRVTGKYSPHPERAAEGADAAQDAFSVAQKRLNDGRALAPRIAQLQEEIGALEGRPLLRAEDALDFISDQKALLRVSPEWQPSTKFEKLVGDLIRKADDAYSAAAVKSGNGEVVRNLGKARMEYREMMDTIYDDAIEAALKKNPEDVGRFLWQGGNVSEPQQLQRMLAIAQREGAMSRTQADDLSKAVTRGFMQEAIPDIKAAARWSETLKENPAKRRTWDELTSAPGGHELRQTMKVLEQAAQIATGRDSKQIARLPFGIVLGRAAQGGLGVSLVTGTIHPLMAAGGLSIAALTKAMATAYTRGDKGALNTIAKVIRLRDASTPAATQALRAALDDLEAKAVEYGIDLVGEQQEEVQ